MGRCDDLSMAEKPLTTKKPATARKSTGRTCSICSHPQVRQINSLIRKGVSIRGISAKYSVTDSSLCRHLEKHLKLQVAAVIEKQQEAQAIDVIAEFTSLLAETKEALEASKAVLTVNGKIDFNPRAWEVEVVYLDPAQTDKDGNMFPQKEPLADILYRLKENWKLIPQHTFVKIQDMRKIHLEAIAKTDSLLDRFAKLGGLYQDNKANPQNEAIKQITAMVTTWAEKSGKTFDETLQDVLADYGNTIPPEIRQKLTSEMVM